MLSNAILFYKLHGFDFCEDMLRQFNQIGINPEKFNIVQDKILPRSQHFSIDHLHGIVSAVRCIDTKFNGLDGAKEILNKAPKDGTSINYCLNNEFYFDIGFYIYYYIGGKRVLSVDYHSEHGNVKPLSAVSMHVLSNQIELYEKSQY